MVAADGAGDGQAAQGPVPPTGMMNTTDHDSRGQRRTACRATTRSGRQRAQQVVIAAELTTDSPDFGHLEPMVRATQRRAAPRRRDPTSCSPTPATGISARSRVASDGIQVLVPPDAEPAPRRRPGWTGGLYDACDACSPPTDGRALYRQRQATIEPVFGHIKFNRGSNASNAAAEPPAAANGG